MASERHLFVVMQIPNCITKIALPLGRWRQNAICRPKNCITVRRRLHYRKLHYRPKFALPFLLCLASRSRVSKKTSIISDIFGKFPILRREDKLKRGFFFSLAGRIATYPLMNRQCSFLYTGQSFYA